MKIVMIIPELITGGAQRSFSKLSLDLSQVHEVHVVVFNSDLPVEFKTGGRLHSLDVRKGDTLLQKVISFARRIKRLKRLKLTLKPEISISFLEGADYINILSAIGEKVVVSIRGSKAHDADITGVTGWVRRRILIPLLYKKASHIVTVSRELKNELTGLFQIPPEKISTIHNYYDVREIERQCRELLPENFTISLTGKILITIGRLHIAKNHKFLIDVFTIVQKELPDSKLLIVGDGPLKEELHSFAKHTGLKVYIAGLENQSFSDNYSIYFFGSQQNPFAFLRRADLFVLPSAYEGFPNVLVESMICGVPVIAADCTYGPREILAVPETTKAPINSAYGVLANTANQANREIWVKLILKLLADEILRKKLSDNGRERAKAFSKDLVLDHWHALIKQLKT